MANAVVMGNDALAAITVFILIYALIVTEAVQRTKAALFGGVLLLVMHLLTQAEAVSAIDFNTLGLLIGMMIIVAITQRTGLFQYLAVKAAKAVGGRPGAIFVVFFWLTAVASALLDNVTTVLLLTGIIFSLTKELDLEAQPFLVMEIIAANIGGTATLIGDPPNIMIGSATGLGFNDFIINLGVPVLLCSLVICFLLFLFYRRSFKVAEEKRQRVLALVESDYLINRVLLKKSLAVLALVMIGFSMHQQLQLESASIAMGGAALLLLISGLEPEEVLAEVEWNTIFFFVGLFILVGALEVTGVITYVASWALHVTAGDVVLMNFLVLWLSALASAFVDNIPFVAAMIPLLQSMAAQGQIDVSSLWWALALGACLGGNGTLVGASANVVVSSLAAAAGKPLTFAAFFRLAFPLMLISIVISNIYLYLAYLH